MQPATVPPPTTKRPGRGFVITGIALMVLAVVAVVTAVAVFGSQLDLNSFSRDAAVSGSNNESIPGQIGFRVIESLSSDEETMNVGVAVSNTSTDIDCEIVTVRNEPVPSRRGTGSDTLAREDIPTSWVVVVVADDLAPGEYSARCDTEAATGEGVGEPSAAPAGSFGVGRVLTLDEVFDLAGPAFGVLGAVLVGGLVGLVGLILLIVGLVTGNRARKRPPSGPGGPGGPWSPPSGGPPQPPTYGGPKWNQPPGRPPAPPPWVDR